VIKVYAMNTEEQYAEIEENKKPADLMIKIDQGDGAIFRTAKCHAISRTSFGDFYFVKEKDGRSVGHFDFFVEEVC